MALGLTLLATVACDVAVPRSDSATAANRPNILIYLVDTLRADALGVYGNPVVLTPNIDAFAADSVVF
ncbi:MAG: sulfatase, partial [Myxococcales bacterium]|nr:sulfatase [Myxococcales bacterium]